MASSIHILFPPHALARSHPRNPRRPFSRKLPTNPKPSRLKTRHAAPPLSSTSGGEATTYTRLPPKDDFFSPVESSTEVKLSDLAVAVKPSILKPGNSSTDDDGGEELSRGDEKFGFDYGKFELFEVDSDYETDADEVLEEGAYESGVFEGIEEEEEVGVKEKGVPAVMRCFDRAKIYVRSGDGGNGVMAFHREKFVPFGGPSGGDGGRGGNVYMEVDSSMNSLLPFRQSIHYRAERGSHGQGKKMNGAKGEDVVVKVPPGTVVKGVHGEVLFELLNPGERALILRGGRGGRGNASFKSGTNKVPKIAEDGEEGAEM